jgi:hypothetical protein
MGKIPTPPTIDGIWAPSDRSTTDATTNEIIVARVPFLDNPNDSIGPPIRSVRDQAPATLPYPEASWWSKARIGSRGFDANGTMQPTVLMEAGFVILDMTGAAIQVSP